MTMPVLRQFQAYYFLRNKLVGQSVIPSAFPPRSLVYVCATCGEVWARVAVEGEPWLAITSPCESHGPSGVSDWDCTPGSLLRGSRGSAKDLSIMFWAATVEYLPQSLYPRELQLAITYAEKLQGELQPC